MREAWALRYVVFGATALLIAVLVVFAWLAVRAKHPWATLPNVSLERLESFPADTLALSGYAFSGFVQSGPEAHWVRVTVGRPRAVQRFRGPHPVRLELTLAGGAGSPTFSGWVDPDDGNLHVYIERASSHFSEFRRVEGRLAGPALVNGVPTLYFEARPASASRVTIVAPSRWVGRLVAQESL